MTTIGAAVVAYRSDRALPALLASLLRWEPGVEVVVVDNASPGGPPHVDPPHRLIEAERNGGFGAGCNLGAAELLAAGVEYLVFLNPDVRLRGPSLSELAAAMDEQSDVGVATGPVVDGSGDRVPSAWGPRSAARAFWSASGWSMPRLRRIAGRVARGGASLSGASMVHDDLGVSGHVLGGAMIVRRKCFEQLGGFDESYFMFGEDTDLCFRARQLGWKVKLLPCTPIEHHEGTSSKGVTDLQRWVWYRESADRFARQHLSAWHRRRLAVALRAGHLLRRRG